MIKFYSTYKLFVTKRKQHKRLNFAYKTLFAFIIIALFAPLLSNDKPLFVIYKSTILFPAFSLKNELIINNDTINYNMGKEWKLIETNFSIFPLCAYSPNTIDADNAPRVGPFTRQILTLKNKSIIDLPFKYRHWLGTTQNGTDVLSGLIYGARVTLLIGFFAMLLATLIGLFLGAIAGYYSKDAFTTTPFQTLFIVIGLLLGCFYAFIVRDNNLSSAFEIGGIELIISVLITILLPISFVYVFSKLGSAIDYKLALKKQFHIPLDGFISEIIKVLSSIPAILLILAITAIGKPSHALLILIIALLGWINIARITRAEYIKATQFDYVTACKAFGMSNFKIMFSQILPNVIPIILVPVIFGITSTVLLESTLSFLGVGVPINIVTWGSLLNEARNYYQAWWLVVFPTSCLLLLTLSLNYFGDFLSKK